MLCVKIDISHLCWHLCFVFVQQYIYPITALFPNLHFDGKRTRPLRTSRMHRWAFTFTLWWKHSIIFYKHLNISTLTFTLFLETFDDIYNFYSHLHYDKKHSIILIFTFAKIKCSRSCENTTHLSKYTFDALMNVNLIQFSFTLFYVLRVI